MTQPGAEASLSHCWLAALCAWLTVLAIDLFVNAGLLSGTFDESDPVLLSNVDAAKRIPVAYGAWALQVLALQWLLARLRVEDVRSAWRYGAAAGFLAGGLSLAALWTIVRLEAWLTGAWIVAGAVEGAAAAVVLVIASRQGRRVLRPLIPAWVASAVGAIVLQNAL